MISMPELPPLENRSDFIQVVGQNVLGLFVVIEKWERLSQAVLKNPTKENQEKYKQIDEILRTLLNIMPELEKPSD